jgi:hypothetical protein
MERLPNGSATTVDYRASSPTALPSQPQQYHYHWLPPIQQVVYGDNNYPQYHSPGDLSIDPTLATAGSRASPVRGVMPLSAINSPYGQGPLISLMERFPEELVDTENDWVREDHRELARSAGES